MNENDKAIHDRLVEITSEYDTSLFEGEKLQIFELPEKHHLNLKNHMTLTHALAYRSINSDDKHTAFRLIPAAYAEWLTYQVLDAAEATSLKVSVPEGQSIQETELYLLAVGEGIARNKNECFVFLDIGDPGSEEAKKAMSLLIERLLSRVNL